jgi:hypothetical protein
MKKNGASPRVLDEIATPLLRTFHSIRWNLKPLFVDTE